MENFDREIKKAAEEYVMSEYSADVPSDFSEETKMKIESILKEETMKTTKKYPMKRGFKVLLAAAVVALLGVVVAASPQIIEYINMKFLKEDSTARLTEVPEGYVGIYTAEDLDNVRNDLTANYILMNDIVITEEDYAEGGIFEGGFEPIGDEFEPYSGTFNGNGYVIDGLHIRSSADKVGLFSKCARKIVYTYETDENGDVILNENGNKIVKEAHNIGGLIKNLGLRNGSIEVDYDKTNDKQPELYVGAFAGDIDYLVGCFAENFKITVENTTGISDVAVGGLAGVAEYIDSCYSVVDITVTNSYDGGTVKEYAEYIPSVGGIAGSSYSCVTSYFDGTIDSEYESSGITSGIQYYVPMILTSDVMDEIRSRLLEIGDEFSAKKFLAYYVSSEGFDDVEVVPLQDYLTMDAKNVEYYMLTPDAGKREVIALDGIIKNAFPDDTFTEYCIANNIKASYYYNYDLRDDPDCTFEGFDFDYIWNQNDGGAPTLKLFEGGSGK